MPTFHKIGECQFDLDMVMIEALDDPEFAQNLDMGYEKAMHFTMMNKIVERLINHHSDAYDDLMAKSPDMKALLYESAQLNSTKLLDPSDAKGIKHTLIAGVILRTYLDEILAAVANIRCGES